jgi:hypothetical protein
MNYKLFKTVLFFLSLFSCNLILAQEPNTKNLIAEETSKDKQTDSKENNHSKSEAFKPELSVFVDAYYAKSNVRYTERKRPFVVQAVQLEELSINHAIINVEKETTDFRYALGLQTGTYTEANYAHEPTMMKHIFQGYAGFKLMDNLWFDAGVFPSHIGGESTLSIDNFNYTRSLVADNSPYYETGARLVYNATEKLSFSLYALNGWQVIKDNNRDNAGGLQIEYKINEKWLLNYSNFIGNEAPDHEKRQTRYFQNFYTKGKLTDRWEVYLLFDIGFQKKRDLSWTEKLDRPYQWISNTPTDSYYRWTGFTLQSYFHLTEKWKLGLRYEGFFDKNQVIIFTGSETGYQLQIASINLDYKPAKNVLVRLEGKSSAALDKIYMDANGSDTNRENLAVFSIAVKH